MSKKKFVLLLLFFSGIAGCRVFSYSYPGPLQHLERAEHQTRQGRYEEAIKSYYDHINYRLTLKDRPEWENPYFYLLIIGDLRLRNGEVDAALDSYTEAEQLGIDAQLITDRFRMVSRWYEERGELEEALEIATRFRDRDHLIFDGLLDRLAKEIVRREEKRERP